MSSSPSSGAASVTAMITPTMAPATFRAATSPGSRPARLAMASPITSIVRVSSSTARARISGTDMVSSTVSRSRARSAVLSPAAIVALAARIAAIGPRSAGWA